MVKTVDQCKVDIFVGESERASSSVPLVALFSISYAAISLLYCLASASLILVNATSPVHELAL